MRWPGEGRAEWGPGVVPPRPSEPPRPDHPIRLVVDDDRRRSRLTVAFRLLLAIPHLIWWSLWGFFTLLLAVLAWLIALVRGRLPDGLHDFFAMYIRYTTQLWAYVLLAANPYPGFGGTRAYPVDVEIDGPGRQRRWTILVRLLLAIPALMLMAALIGAPDSGGGGYTSPEDPPSDEELAWTFWGGLAYTVAVFGWFASLVRGAMPHGFRDAVLWALRYQAQTLAYLLLVTQRYPSTDPFDLPTRERVPSKPVRIVIADDGRRSRLMILFRLPLAIPHLVWLVLWSVVAFLAAIANWFVTLVRGRSPRVFHRFLSAYLRYWTHVYAFLLMAGNPFPGFTGAPGRYPVDLEVDGPDRQSRWVTLFRIFLVVPAWVVSGALMGVAFLAAFLGWFVALVKGRMPVGIRNAIAYAIRYAAQVSAYGFLVLTDSYPYSGPAERPVAEPEPELAAG